MPSRHQTGVASGDYDSEPKKMLATKNGPTIKALVKGIRRVDRARAYVEAEVDLAREEDREPRRKLVGMLNSKIDDLQASEEGASG